MTGMGHLLREIFNHDFAACKDAAEFHSVFFTRPLALPDLKKISERVRDSHVELGGQRIPAAIRIPGHRAGAPFGIVAQLHGNEPAGLAGILLAMALAEAGKLSHDVIGVIGNPLAAAQYFAAWEANPKSRQETRDAFRCGLDENGALLPDMNRIPVTFATEGGGPHISRARELYAFGRHIGGILDIHSARGNMVCVTDHRDDKHLQHSPIRAVLTGLADAISAHASAKVAVRTLKTTLSELPNIKSQTGIEAGRHEDPDAPRIAASFTLSLLHTLGITGMAPLHKKENGEFKRYEVQPRITFADLAHKGALLPDDRVYMAMECDAIERIPPGCDRVIVEQKDGRLAVQTILQYMVRPEGTLRFATHQYDEMEAIRKNQTVAVAVPSGTVFKVSSPFSGIFLSKSAALYDKDPNVGPWPVAAADLGRVKFCYPCKVSKWVIAF